jgi:hypothetical protein
MYCTFVSFCKPTFSGATREWDALYLVTLCQLQYIQQRMETRTIFVWTVHKTHSTLNCLPFMFIYFMRTDVPADPQVMLNVISASATLYRNRQES